MSKKLKNKIYECKITISKDSTLYKYESFNANSNVNNIVRYIIAIVLLILFIVILKLIREVIYYTVKN
ncbi:hypothetical protein D3C87_1779220 [compost metagenome]